MKLRSIAKLISVVYLIFFPAQADSIPQKTHALPVINSNTKAEKRVIKFLAKSNIFNIEALYHSLDHIKKPEEKNWLKVAAAYQNVENNGAQSLAWIIYYHLYLDERLLSLTRSMAAIGLSQMATYKKALSLAQSAVNLDKGNGRAYLRLAKLLSNYTEKRRTYKTALTLGTINRDNQTKFKALMRLGILCERNYDYQGANKYYDQANSMLANNDIKHNRLKP